MNTTKNIVKSAMLAAITAVLAQVVLPVGPIPFNLAVLGAYLAGMLLSPAWATFSMFAYMFMGVVGLPVFAGFKGGAGVLFNTTGGYIFGYMAIALLTSLGRNSKWYKTATLMVLGLFVCYALGTTWFMIFTGTNLVTSLTACVTPFILPDLAKAFCAYSIGKILNTSLKRMNA